MPRVPTQDLPSVLPSAAPGGYQNITANPAAFGAGQGQAMQQAGQALGQAADMIGRHAMAQAGLNAEAEAKDLDIKAAGRISERLFSTAPANSDDPGGGVVGYFGAKGKAAVDGGAQAIADIQKIREDALAGTSNPETRRMLDQVLTRRVMSAQDQIRQHASREQTTWWNESSQGRIGLARNDALNNYTNPNALRVAELTILSEVSDQGQHNGWAPEIVQMKAQQEVSDLYKGVIERMAIQPEGENSGPLAAKAYYAANRSRIQGAQHEQLEKFLQPLVDRAVVRTVVDQVKTGAAAASLDAVAQQAGAAGIDPKLALTTAGIESSFGRDPRATNLGQVKDATAAGVGETNGGTPADQARVMAKVLAQAQDAAGQALGRAPENWQTYLTYQQGIGGGPALLKADPNANAVQVLAAVYKNADKAEAAIVGNGGRPDMTVGQFLDKWRQTYRQREAAVAVPDAATRALAAEQGLDAQMRTIEGMALSPEQKDAARSRLLSDYHQTEALAAAEQKALRTQVMQIMVGGKISNIDQIPPELWAKAAADPDLQRSVMAMAEHNAKGKDVTPTEENQKLWARLHGMAATDPVGFSDLDLGQYYNQMPLHQWQQLVQMHDAIDRKAANQQDRGQMLNNALANAGVKQIFGKSGLEPPGKGKKPSDDYMEATGRLSLALQAWRASNPGTAMPSDGDLQRMAAGIVQTVTVPGWLGTSWSKRLYQVPAGTSLGEVTYTIPPAEQRDIIAAFRRANGRDPRPDEINARYHARLSRAGITFDAARPVTTD